MFSVFYMMSIYCFGGKQWNTKIKVLHLWHDYYIHDFPQISSPQFQFFFFGLISHMPPDITAHCSLYNWAWRLELCFSNTAGSLKQIWGHRILHFPVYRYTHIQIGGKKERKVSTFQNILFNKITSFQSPNIKNMDCGVRSLRIQAVWIWAN